MRHVGIEVCADRSRTAVAIVDTTRGVHVEHTVTGPSDEQLARLVTDERVTGVGITAPLITPPNRHVVVSDLGVDISADVDAVRAGLTARFLVRATDRHLMARLAHLPPRLHPTAQTRGTEAVRGRRLLALLPGDQVDPSGVTGRVVEVDPCAALDAWGLPYAGYVGFAGSADLAEVRETVVASLAGRLMVDASELGIRDGSQLNAVIAALVAVMSRTGLVESIPAEHVDAARREGWMTLPTAGSLESLRGAVSASLSASPRSA